ncbi:1-propanol dehydrogenase PduQ [Brooklawnia sp.]|uniref:1-propanol dehydrogenase PduQ n=1 Tax=Brooklawnia sp. TaxID=2699740 RepID=UPI00311DC096
MHRFQLRTTLCYGPEALGELSGLSGRRVLIVTDGFMVSTPLMARVRDQLGDAIVEVFDQVQPNPDINAVTAGLRAYNAFDPQAVLAIGGGSAIDTAKVVRKLAIEQGRHAESGFFILPTTSGTGSEVSSYAVVTDHKSHAKLPLESSDMVADVAILDPEAVRTAPPRLTADSGMDAISHAVEAYVGKGHNDFSDALAEKSLRLAHQYLVRSFLDGDDMEAREHQHTAATMAGIAFENSSLGIVHGLSHSIGGSFRVAHGRLNGILLPHVIAFNAGELGFAPSGLTPTARRYAALAAALGLTAASQRNLVPALCEWIKKLRRDLEMPASITEAGVNRSEYVAAIPRIAQQAAGDYCTSGNPVPAGTEQLAAILTAIA